MRTDSRSNHVINIPLLLKNPAISSAILNEQLAQQCSVGRHNPHSVTSDHQRPLEALAVEEREVYVQEWLVE